MDPILAPTSVDIGRLRADLTSVLESAGDNPIAVLDAQKAVGYLLPPKARAKICTLLEDAELMEIVNARVCDGKTPVRVCIDDLHRGEGWGIQNFGNRSLTGLLTINIDRF